MSWWRILGEVGRTRSQGALNTRLRSWGFVLRALERQGRPVRREGAGYILGVESPPGALRGGWASGEEATDGPDRRG